MPTLMEIWQESIVEYLTNTVQEVSVEDLYNDLVEEHENFVVTFIDAEDLTPEQIQELPIELTEFGRTLTFTDLEALLYRYGKQMLCSEEEWVCEKIQEILDEQFPDAMHD